MQYTFTFTKHNIKVLVEAIIEAKGIYVQASELLKTENQASEINLLNDWAQRSLAAYQFLLNYFNAQKSNTLVISDAMNHCVHNNGSGLYAYQEKCKIYYQKELSKITDITDPLYTEYTEKLKDCDLAIESLTALHQFLENLKPSSDINAAVDFTVSCALEDYDQIHKSFYGMSPMIDEFINAYKPNSPQSAFGLTHQPLGFSPLCVSVLRKEASSNLAANNIVLGDQNQPGLRPNAF